MIDTTTVGKGIACLRKQRQMTQQGLAAAVNVSHQAVSKWENGVALPDMQTMLALSRLFGVSMEDILSGAVLETAMQDEPAPAEPVAKPAIELKLDPEPLNLNIVAEADDVIARAMKSCEDETQAQPESEGTVNVGMRFDEIVHMAPYVSGDALSAMLAGCEDEYSMSDLVSVASFMKKDSLGRLVAGCKSVDWDSMRRLAPFLSRDALRDVVLGHIEELSMENLRRLAPFMSRDGLAEILSKMPVQADFAELKRLAPFMSKDSLGEQLNRYVDRLSIDDLLAFAPFLRKDQLGELVEKIDQPIDRSQMVRLAKYLPRDQMDRLVYRAMGVKRPKPRSSDWDVSIDLGRAYHEIRDAVHTGMQEAREAIRMVGLDSVVDGINSTMKDVGGRINEVINTAWNQQPRQNASQNRAQRIRTRIAEKALAEGNWDWLSNHASELEGDILKQMLMKCAAVGHEELIGENIDRIQLSSAEACRLAQTVTDEEIWERLLEGMEADHRTRVLDYIARAQPESLARFGHYADAQTPLEAALQAMRSGEGAEEMMGSLDANDQLELIRTALQEDYSDIGELVERMDAVITPQVLEAMLQTGNTDWIGDVAKHADAADLPAMAAALVNHGEWDHLDELLDGVADVDLSGVWPLAIEKQRWDIMDDIALHGDEATLTGMAMALAELGRFDDMDSFVEELDPDTLEKLLDKAMEQSNWEAIDRLSELLN